MFGIFKNCLLTVEINMLLPINLSEILTLELFSIISNQMTSIYNNLWYRYTTFINSGGDVSRWHEMNNDGTWMTCKGLVRREDGLVFRNSLSCNSCNQIDIDPNTGEPFTHAQRNGDFLVGVDTFGTKYNKDGRVLPTTHETRELVKKKMAHLI